MSTEYYAIDGNGITRKDTTLNEFWRFTDYIVDDEGNVIGILNPWLDSDVEACFPPNVTLNKREMSDVLKLLHTKHDSQIGINEAVIRTTVLHYIEEKKKKDGYSNTD